MTNNKQGSKINIILLSVLIFVLCGCNSKYHILVPHHKYVISETGYMILGYRNDNYFFPMEVDSTKEFFNDFLDKNPNKGFKYVFGSKNINPIFYIEKYATKIEIKPRNDKTFTHAYIMPAKISYLENAYTKTWTKKQARTYYEEKVCLEGHEINFIMRDFRFKEISLEVAPLLSDSVYTKLLDDFYHKIDTLEIIEPWEGF
ncbi:MAG: hypothetical protein U9R42_10410 [Bacteroidota bacterium]|nr:hypothetical protein [Bacteroidota bacterium]